MLLEIAEGQLGPWAAAPCGHLILRSLVQVSEGGRVLVTDRGLDVLSARADSLAGCVEGSSEEAELERLADVLERSER